MNAEKLKAKMNLIRRGLEAHTHTYTPKKPSPSAKKKTSSPRTLKPHDVSLALVQELQQMLADRRAELNGNVKRKRLAAIQA